MSPSPNVVRVIDLANALEVEPNDAVAQATAAGAAPLAAERRHREGGRRRLLQVHRQEGAAARRPRLCPQPLRSPLDPVLVVYNAQGGGIAGNDDTRRARQLPAVHRAGRRRVPGRRVATSSSSGGPDYVYRVELTEVKPALTMGLPERQQYVPTTLTVPKGNRMAVMVAAQRAEFWRRPERRHSKACRRA